MSKPSMDDLTPELTAKTQQARNPQLAIEALRKLTADESAKTTRNNVIQQRAFSERITELMKKYTNQQLTSAEVIAEQVELARGVAVEGNRGSRFTPRIVLHQYGIKPAGNLFDACKLEKDGISVDAKELLQRCISKIPTRERNWSLQELTDQAHAYVGMLGSEGLHGRGHDIAPILIKYFKLKGHQAIPEIVETQLRTSLHVSELKEWPLFSQLAMRLGERN